METSNEKYFDDQIRKKLSDVEAAAISWDEFAASNQADLIAIKSLRRFLFSDLILLLFLSSYLLLNEYGFSNQLNGSETLFNKSKTISTNNKNTISQDKSQKTKTDFSDQSDVASVDVSDRIITNESNNIENQILDSKNTSNVSNDDEINKIGNSIQSNNNVEAFNNKNVKSYSHKNSNKNISYAADGNFSNLVSIDNIDLDFLNAKDFILFPSNDSNSIDELNKSTINQIISNPGLFPISVEVYGIFNYDISKISKKSENFNVKLPKQNNFSNNGIGIGLRYLLGKKFAIQTGVEYLVSNYNLKYNINGKEQGWMIDSITGYVISPFDPPIPYTIYDTTLSEFTVQKNYEVSMEEKSIVIPVYLVYRLRKNNWSFETVSGASMNVNSTTKINTSNNVNNENKEINSLLPKYSNGIRFSVYLGISLARQISDNLEIFTQPSLQVNINNSTSNESLTAIRNRYAGLKIGLRYQFTQK